MQLKHLSISAAAMLTLLTIAGCDSDDSTPSDNTTGGSVGSVSPSGTVPVDTTIVVDSVGS